MFLVSADFVQNHFFFEKKKNRNTIRVTVKQFGSRLSPTFGPDLGPNCLQSLSIDDTSGQRVEVLGNMMLAIRDRCETGKKA